MLAAATSFFARTAISQSYNIGTPPTGSRSSTPGPNGSSSATTSPVPAPFTPSFIVGLWRVQSASHKVTNKRVSVWSFDKRGPDMDRLGPLAKERTLEVMKAEGSALGRLRHPSILEMVEPLEETRNELIFATEPLLSSLDSSIPGSSRHSPLVELDEVEIQKGILQICKGLSFLHSSAQLIHSNICPESIVINSSGDWKIAGLGLTIPLLGPNGSPTRWEFPTFDGRVPPYIQRSFDYMAPEYALDEILATASDMYSLGCLIYAVHSKGNPPFKTHGSLGGLRENAGKTPPMEQLDPDLQALLRILITRHPSNRPTPTTLESQRFFSSLPISTLNFLDRSNFTSKTKEEKISFMKGLSNVLDKFSQGLRTRKILPSLLEEMKDSHLLPYILPNVFAIASALSPSQFAAMVLPSLKPLFIVKEPPQNMLTLLDNLTLLQTKTEKIVFREQVLPLVYNALESEHAMVQERALQAVPDLCETVDYAEVQGVLFPRVALVFTKTRILTVKVATLTTFLAMVKTLDQMSLTQKLVPLLSKIRTKEPAVTMATLSVQEAMGFKVDREAVATHVLPQLWAMAMSPLLNVDQFQRFMLVIRKLGERVEKEHNQFLRDSQRFEDRSAATVNGASGTQSFAGTVDFESLVGGRTNGAASVKPDTEIDNNKAWDDDVWGSIFSNGNAPSPSLAPTPASPPPMQPLPSPRHPSGDYSSPRPPRLGARSIAPPPSFRSNSFSPPQPQSQYQPQSHSSQLQSQSRPSYSFASPSQPLQPNLTGGASSQNNSQPAKPNYNISLPPANTQMMPMTPTSPAQPSYASHALPPPMAFSSPLVATPPAMGSLLAPSKPSQPSWSTTRAPTKDDWGDFDPLG